MKINSSFIKLFLVFVLILIIVIIYSNKSSDDHAQDHPSLDSKSQVHSEKSKKHEENLSLSTFKTKKDHKSKVLTLEELLMKVNQNEKLTSEELFMSLNNMFKISPKKQHLSLTLKMTAIFHYLDKNYEDYKQSIGQLYSDNSVPDLLRLPMLQIIDKNFDDSSRALIENVFSHYKSEDEWILGESALVLAKHDIDISQEIIDRYDLAGDIGKSFYAQSLAHLNTTEALSMIQESIPQMQNVKAKSSLLQAYAKLSINSPDEPDTINTLFSIANTVNIQKNTTIKDEIYSIQAVMALGSIKSESAFKSLLQIAQKEDALPSTRIAALESLSQSKSSQLKSIQGDLKQIELDLEKTNLIDTIDKQRIQKRIHYLINKN